MSDYKKITIEDYQKSHKENFSLEELRGVFGRWESYDSQGKRVIDGLSPFLSKQVHTIDYFFPVYFGAIENLFSNKSLKKQFNSNEKKLYSVKLALYDSLLNLHRSYRQKSSMGCSAFARIIFEARVNLQVIEQDPEKNCKLYSDHKQILTWWHEYKSIENPSEDDRNKLREKLKKHPTWYDENWKVMKKKGEWWTGDKDESLRDMAKRTGASYEYNVEYVINSKFSHVSPLLENYYLSTGNSPICNEHNLIQIVAPALNSFSEAIKSLYNIIGLDGFEVYVALHVPFMVHFSKEHK